MAVLWINGVLGFSILIFYIAILFLLHEIRIRSSERFASSFLYLMIGVLVLVVRRIIYLLNIFQVIQIAYINEVLSTISLFFSIFLLMSLFTYLNRLRELTQERYKPSAKKAKGIRRYRKKEKIAKKPKSHKISDRDLIKKGL